MTVDDMRKLRHSIFLEFYKDMENADKKLALALIKARRDEAEKCRRIYVRSYNEHEAIKAMGHHIDTLTAALKAGGRK